MSRLFTFCAAAAVLASSPAAAFDIPPEEWDDWGETPPSPGTPTPSGPTPAKPAENPPPPPRSTAEAHPSGTVVLPTSGLRVDLPAVTGVVYKVSGRWGYAADDTTVTWARDTIDEQRNKKLVGATWYHVGPFKVGNCKDVLAAVELADAFVETFDLHGMRVDARGGTYLFQNSLGARPVVIICGGDPDQPLLLYRFFFEEGAPTALPRDRLLSGLRASPVVQQIVSGHRVERWSRVRPLEAANVNGAPAEKRPTSFRLGVFNGAVEPPRDGALWVHATKGDADRFERRVPRFPDMTVRFMKGKNITCDKGFQNIRADQQKKGRTLLPTLPSPAGWRAGLTAALEGDRAFSVLCRSTRQGTAFAEVSHPKAMGDVSDVEGLLGAFVKAVDGPSTAPPTPVSKPPAARPRTTPAPVRPASPRPAPRRRVWRDEIGTMTSFDLAVAVSHRDSPALGLPEDAFPSLRVAGPGVSLQNLLFQTDGGLLLRTSVSVLPDAAAALDDALVSTARHGGQVWEGAAELGLAFSVGDDDLLGVTLGWHGLAGPLLLNSSLAASLYWIHMPEEPEAFGWSLRVTPAQFIPANERVLMSPLSVDWRMAVDGFGLGLEVQWVGAPKAGEEDIPGEGIAAIIRLGFGGFSF